MLIQNLCRIIRTSFVHFCFTLSPADDEDRRRELETLRIAEENRKLRRVVKRRLKQWNAKKYARLWKKKWECRKKKQNDFVGIVHLSLEDYFRLWGKNGDQRRLLASSHLVEEISANAKTIAWSSKLLNARPLRVNYMGEKLAQTVAHYARLASARRNLKIRNVICWKIFLSLPYSGDESYRAFVQRIIELCRAFYCKGDSQLSDVSVTEYLGVKVYTAMHLDAGPSGTGDLRDFCGVTSVVLFVHKNWESDDELRKRLRRIYESLAYPCFLSLVVLGDYEVESTIEPMLQELRQRNALLGSKVTKWKNFFTLPKVIFEACRQFPLTPPFEVKSLAALMANVGNDFFAHLSVLTGDDHRNSLTYCLERFNKFLLEVRRVICEQDAVTFNLAAEFLPAIVGREKASNNLSHKESVATLVSKYLLPSFTKWPPKSVRKMEKLLTEYCHAIDSGNTLLANVLRLVDWREKSSVQEIDGTTPWLKIVELWFIFNASVVSARENAENVFVFYDEREINHIVDSLWNLAV